jgi:hypothetical protein
MLRRYWLAGWLVLAGCSLLTNLDELRGGAAIDAGDASTCPAGYADCNGLASDGCEMKIDDNVYNCGGCNRACVPDNGSPSCVASKCVFDCTPGWADCDQSGSNGCEADLTADPKNCGACGHSCQGGACKDGVCQAVVLAPSVNALWLDTDGTFVFWTDFGDPKGTVQRINTDGTAAWTVASSQGAPDGLALDQTAVYWVDFTSGTIMRANKDGSNVYAIAQMPGANFFWIAVDGTDVYVSNDVDPNGGGGIYRAPKTGVPDAGPPTLVAGQRGWPRGLQVDQSYVYWCEDEPTTPYRGNIERAPKDGGPPVTLATTDGGYDYPWIMRSDSTAIYWRNLYNDLAIYKINKDGTGFTALTPPETAVDIAVDDQAVYYSVGGTAGNIVVLPKNVPDASPYTLLPGVGAVGALAVDDASVYFSLYGPDGGESILKVAK